MPYCPRPDVNKLHLTHSLSALSLCAPCLDGYIKLATPSLSSADFGFVDRLVPTIRPILSAFCQHSAAFLPSHPPSPVIVPRLWIAGAFGDSVSSHRHWCVSLSYCAAYHSLCPLAVRAPAVDLIINSSPGYCTEPFHSRLNRLFYQFHGATTHNVCRSEHQPYRHHHPWGHVQNVP